MMADRFKDVVRAVLDELFPERRFVAGVEYRVSKAEGGKFSASPIASDVYPTITDAPIRGIIAGNAATKLRTGSSILVGWINGDRARPYLIDVLEPPSELALTAVTKATLDAPQVIINNGVQGVARMGDPVLAGPFPGTITMGSTTTKAG